jgi:Cof subfamily protein (haloacid dehalogenase superfamily)
VSRYNLIALDLDGTLLNSKKQLSDKTAEAVAAAVAEGKEVVINTGRGPTEVYEFLDRLPGIRYLNVLSGCMIYDLKEKKEIYSKMLDVDTMLKLFKIAELEDCMPHILSLESYVQKDHIPQMDKYNKIQYQDLYYRVANAVDNIFDFYYSDPFPSATFHTYHTDLESMYRTEQRIKNLNMDLYIACADECSLEVTPKGSNKGVGLKKLCEHLGIDISETIAVGDADNDRPALSVAGLSVAMANAEEVVKEMCDVIVSDNDHDGCAEAIYKYLLG